MIPINHQPELKTIYYNIITDHNRFDALQAEAMREKGANTVMVYFRLYI